MKKLTFLVLGLLLVLGPFGASAMNEASLRPTALPSEVLIGLLSPQSGALSTYTTGFENGANLAIKELNADTDYNDVDWKLKVYDTKTTPEGASAAMTAAVTDGAVLVVGAAGSSNTLSAAAIAKTEQVPLISYASTSPELSGFDDDDYLWRTAPSDAFQGKALSDIAVDQGYETAVVIYVDNAYGIGVRDNFKTPFEAAGGSVLKSIGYNPESFEVGPLVEEIDAESPDVVIAVSYGVDGAAIFVQMADQNLNVPVIGGDGVADNAIVDEATGTAAAIVNLVATKPAAPASASVTAFEAAYDAEYPTASGDIYTGEAYDAVWIGAMAIHAADSVAGADIIVELAKTDFDGGSGKKVFDANGDITAATYSVLEFQSEEDGYVEVGTWADGTLTLDADFTQQNAVRGSALPFPMFAFLTVFLAIPILRRKNE